MPLVALAEPLQGQNHRIQMKRARASPSDAKKSSLVVQNQTDVDSSWRTNFEEAQTDRHQFQNVDMKRPEERRP